MYKKYTSKLAGPNGCVQKILLIMRLTTLILITTIMQVSASTFAQQITLSNKNASLRNVLDQISDQSGYEFVFTSSILKNAKPVTIDVKNKDLSSVLQEIFKTQPLKYEINNKVVIISFADTPTFLDRMIATFIDITVAGRVLSSDNQPLPGASVKIKGRNIATRTNENGNFSLSNVSETAILEISYLGYKTKEVKAVKDLGNIILEVSTGELNQVNVVSTGYQTIAKERSAGSVSKPDMNIYNDRVGTLNVIQRLDGLIPGLTVNNAPGADQFQIRGLSTVGSIVNIGGYGVSTTNRSPLFVVDGVPYDDINLINPNDVVDVNVLKDATAASIWGARAANGVIVITTKSGQKGASKLKVDYNSFVRIQPRPDLDYFPVLNSKSFIREAREIFDPALVPWATINGSTAPIVAPHERTFYDLSRGLITAEQANAKLDSMGNISNLGQMSDLLYRTGITNNHSLSVGGGTEKYSFYGSFNYTGNKNSGNRPSASSDIYKLNIRQDFRFNKNVNVYLVTDITNTIGKSSPYPSFDARFTPYQLFQAPNGNNLDLTWRYMTEERRKAIETAGKIDIGYIPLDEPNFGYTKNNGLAMRLNGGIQANLYKGLRFEGTYNYTRAKNDVRQFEDARAFNTRREVLSFTTVNATTGLPTYYMPETGGRLQTTNSSRQDWTIRNQLVYNKDWNNLTHQLTVLGGSEVQSMMTNNVSELIRGFDDNLFTVRPVDYKSLAAGTLLGTLYPSTGGFGSYFPDTYTAQQIDTRLISYYSNLAYSYLEKYGINASWRIDQSNLFGVNKSAQNKPVYSLGALWNLNKENFMQNLSWINELKIRATYGLTGISPAPGTASSDDILLAVAPSGFAVPGGTIYRINSPANRALTWELTKTKNLGLDFRLLDNRISGNFDMYWKKTEGLLDQMLVNPFAVAISPTILGNSGELTNRGIELSLTTINIRTRDFLWRTLLNGAYNRNKITKSYNQRSVTTGNAKVTEQNLQGYPAYAMFAYDFIGLDALGDPQIRLNDGSISKVPFVTKAEDVIFMGTRQPKWSGGFSNFFKYKGVDLQVNMVFNLGHVTRKDVNLRYTGTNTSFNNLHADFENRWKQTGDETETDVPSFVPTSSVNSSRRSEYYYILGDNNVIDASFIKVRDLTLSYSLPKALLSKIKCNELRVFGQLGNLMLWKANKEGIDPEFQSANNLGGIRALRIGQNTIAFGLRVSL
jgi:TonB-linked SusC/RagA family outer membrane protein